MEITNFWSAIALFGFAGFGAGMGLVIGAFIVRTLRNYIKEDNSKESK